MVGSHYCYLLHSEPCLLSLREFSEDATLTPAVLCTYSYHTFVRFLSPACNAHLLGNMNAFWGLQRATRMPFDISDSRLRIFILPTFANRCQRGDFIVSTSRFQRRTFRVLRYLFGVNQSNQFSLNCLFYCLRK